MEAGLGGGSDLSEARRVGRGERGLLGECPFISAAPPPSSRTHAARGPPSTPPAAPGRPIGGDGGSARGGPHEGRPLSCRVFLIRSTARIRCGEVEHRAAGSGSGGARGVGTWLVGEWRSGR